MFSFGLFWAKCWTKIWPELGLKGHRVSIQFNLLGDFWDMSNLIHLLCLLGWRLCTICAQKIKQNPDMTFSDKFQTIFWPKMAIFEQCTLLKVGQNSYFNQSPTWEVNINHRLACLLQKNWHPSSIASQNINSGHFWPFWTIFRGKIGHFWPLVIK